jgi:hypothetical protein
MGRIIKAVIYLLILGFIGLAGFAYLGPAFGVDFSAPQTEVRKPVVLNAD